ncbi:MAG: S9 family peptidase [Caldilineaceae bacterium]|nr:S9 family peptidase [Caldilineaceae bacterium]
MTRSFRIESLLSARQFLAPQLDGEWLYFISDMAGRLSLYRMQVGGSLPQPLLPPYVALQNPHLIGGKGVYQLLPKLGKILIMLDQDGDENYQPTVIPLDGGIPEPLFGERFAGQQVVCSWVDAARNVAIFTVDPRTDPTHQAFWVDLTTLAITPVGRSIHGNAPICVSTEPRQIILADFYTMGDTVLYQWNTGAATRELLYGIPLEQRTPGQEVPLTGFAGCEFTPEKQLLLITALFTDSYGLGYLRFDTPEQVLPVTIQGLVHQGVGELVDLQHCDADHYLLIYNIDGCSWAYEGVLAEAERTFTITRTICGTGALQNGVLEAITQEKATGRYVLSFSTATAPSQLYLIEADDQVIAQTEERLLGLDATYLAAGEDAAYTSHDGLRISARLYLPAPALGFQGKRPVVFYIHGGPQSQERPDFTWFSMPLIQFLTLNGFAVWVPNVRGSTGYGLEYMKRIDHDWGGLDRLDHVAAVTLLRQDARLDLDRAGVMGRSYGGYMTLTLAGRHPELWQAAVDMFGPYDLFSFMDRLPATWQTYFYQALGHPVEDKDFLIERSPSTHLHQLACPMLVIQGANDPRVVEQESNDLVQTLRSQGKSIDYLVFADEGHDVLKFQNKVTCYRQITEFFTTYLKP